MIWARQYVKRPRIGQWANLLPPILTPMSLSKLLPLRGPITEVSGTPLLAAPPTFNAMPTRFEDRSKFRASVKIRSSQSLSFATLMAVQCARAAFATVPKDLASNSVGICVAGSTPHLAACGKSPLLGVQTCDLRNVWDV